MSSPLMENASRRAGSDRAMRAPTASDAPTSSRAKLRRLAHPTSAAHMPAASSGAQARRTGVPRRGGGAFLGEHAGRASHGDCSQARRAVAEQSGERVHRGVSARARHVVQQRGLERRGRVRRRKGTESSAFARKRSFQRSFQLAVQPFRFARAAVHHELGEVRARRGDPEDLRDVHARALDVQRGERRQSRGERGYAPRGEPERAVAQVRALQNQPPRGSGTSRRRRSRRGGDVGGGVDASSTSSSPSPTRSAAARPASASSLNTTALRTSTSKHVRSSTRRHCLLTKRRRPRFAAPRAASKTFSTRPSASASLSFDLRRAASGAGTRNRPPTLQRACAPSLFVSPSRTKRRTRANASSGRKTAPRVSFRRIRSSLPGMTTPRPDAGAVDAPAGTSTWLARAIAAAPARVAASLMTPSRGNEVRARERPGGGGHRRSDADEEDCCAFSMRRPENATTSGAP